MTASIDPLTDRLARVIDGMVYGGGTRGPTVAAIAVLSDYEIDQALRVRRAVTDLLSEHTERRWSADSTSATCTCGRGWPCDVREALDTP